MTVVKYEHAVLQREAQLHGVTVEDMARAWASMDGKRDEFDAGKGKSLMKDKTGHYAGYMEEMEEVLRRAAKYARKRKEKARG